jgi:tRNA dimethylallyltransferase
LSVPPLISIFGPTGVGKTGVAIELSSLLRARGEDPVAVNCDSIQVYRGLEVLSGAADALRQATEPQGLEHRLLSFVPVDEEFSAGRYSELAHAEIDSLGTQGRRPILVGGTGLYLRAALAQLDFRPPVPETLRLAVETELLQRGSAALHDDLPPEISKGIHPNDRKRVARAAELHRSGESPAPFHAAGGRLWTASLRRPAVLVGLSEDPEGLADRIRIRVTRMAEDGAGAEAGKALRAGASRTARAAIGFREFLDGDLEGAVIRHRQFARRQMTWMRRMEGVDVLPRAGRTDFEMAEAVLALADRNGCQDAARPSSG